MYATMPRGDVRGAVAERDILKSFEQHVTLSSTYSERCGDVLPRHALARTR